MTRAIRIPAKHGRIRVAPKEQRTYNGMVFDSKAESRYAAELDLKKRAGAIAEWWRQVPFPLLVNGQRICTMRIDFKILDKNGAVHYVEIKGLESEAWKLRHKLLLACYPGIDYRVVKA